MPIFSPAEMKRRLDNVRSGIAERQLDGCFVHTADNVYYATGVPLLSEWGRPMWMVMRANGESATCGAMIEVENMSSSSATSEILPYDDDENVIEAALRQCARFLASPKRPQRIGVELDAIPHGLHQRLIDHLSGTELVDIGDLFEELRLIKSAEELDILELAGNVAKIGADAFLEALHENATELSVAAHAVHAMDKALGALSGNAATSTYAYAQFGRHTLTPHLHPTTRRLKHGDVVGLNVFPVVWGYCAELERTLVFGPMSTEARQAMDAVNEARDAGIEALRPGVRANEVDRAAREVLERHGYGERIRHGTGHAHGIMIGAAGREEPGELRIYNDRRLEPGMANSVEPGVYLPEFAGFRHSDVFFITESGSRCITQFPRDITYFE